MISTRQQTRRPGRARPSTIAGRGFVLLSTARHLSRALPWVLAAALLGILAWAVWDARREVRHVRSYLRETQRYALYAGDLAVSRNNEIVRLRKRIEALESRRPILPPVGDWEGVMRP